MSVVVRVARETDAPLICALIHELADYQRMADEAKIGEAEVRAILFGATPRAFCDVAEQDGDAVGFALWYYSVSTFEGRHGIYLEDLFVRPAARGRGAGLALLRGLARRCRDEGLARLEWSVLDWNAPAIGFYDRMGASTHGEWLKRRLAGDALARLASL
jgi:GNAT superfamily N-acetyltransferase